MPLSTSISSLLLDTFLYPLRRLRRVAVLLLTSQTSRCRWHVLVSRDAFKVFNPYSRTSMRYDCNWAPFTSRRSLIRCPEAYRFKRNPTCHSSSAAALMRYADLNHFLALDTRSASKRFLLSCHVHRGYAFLFAATPCSLSRQRIVEALVRCPALTSVLPNKSKSVTSSGARIASWPLTVAVAFWSCVPACLACR